MSPRELVTALREGSTKAEDHATIAVRVNKAADLIDQMLIEIIELKHQLGSGRGNTLSDLLERALILATGRVLNEHEANLVETLMCYTKPKG